MSTEKVRVRFAPSPTGPLHMGGVRTALFNYLFARKQGGTFVLRIEDTDTQRFVPGAEKYIIDALLWCGIVPDEGVDESGAVVCEPSRRHPYAPYRQSERKSIYEKYARQLVDQDNAYYAFDTPGELESFRQEAESHGENFIYNHAFRKKTVNSLNMDPAEVSRRLRKNNNWVIRFKVPENKTVAMHDLIRGEVIVQTGTLDDKVLWKAQDGLPTYHLANIVDDYLMHITHVIRGEEWLPSLPLHYLLYESFGWQEQRPQFAHLPLLLKPDGKGKLSKRDGDRLGFPVFPLEWTSPSGEKSRGYREDGYFPEAFVNMIALLGWNPGTEQEIFSMEELTALFSLERVIKSGARFNPEKAKWFNQRYLRNRSDSLLAEEFLPLLRDKGITTTQLKAEKVVSLIRNRADFVSDFWDLSDYFFIPPESYDPAMQKKFWKPEIPSIITGVRKVLALCEPFDAASIELVLHQWIEAEGLKTGQVMNALRLCLVGKPQGPGLADIMAVIGPEDTIKRIDHALNTL
ncbi:MAG: glutamate--tRNA ligase [Bacteroidales bacterium]|jgi:glutamyl-tRNA synthetase|nr:glutamate--tRNA ligase [Bacteroidales bacterium]